MSSKSPWITTIAVFEAMFTPLIYESFLPLPFGGTHMVCRTLPFSVATYFCQYLFAAAMVWNSIATTWLAAMRLSGFAL